MTTQAKSVCVPFKSDMMVGKALATIVLLKIAVKNAASKPVNASMIWRCVICAESAGAAWPAFGRIPTDAGAASAEWFAT
ncbi:hypothetical protein GCM10009569_00970 [Arthrobacter russicus]